MTSKLSTIARYTLLEAARNKLLHLALVVLALGWLATLFVKQVAITETREFQLALLATLYRVAAVFMLAAFIIVSQIREANDKVMELMLTRDLPRAHYLFGKLLGYLAVAVVLAILFTIPLIFLAGLPLASLWGFSLFLELAIIAALSLFCVLALNQVVSSLAAVLACYVLSRSMAALQLIGAAQAADAGGVVSRIAEATLSGVAFFLPRLDLFTHTGWLLGRSDAMPNMPWLVVQSFIYVTLLSLAALFDLRRKNF